MVCRRWMCAGAPWVHGGAAYDGPCAPVAGVGARDGALAACRACVGLCACPWRMCARPALAVGLARGAVAPGIGDCQIVPERRAASARTRLWGVNPAVTAGIRPTI